MILLLHNRYRVPGGEERCVEDLEWLIQTVLGEDVEVLGRDSRQIGRGRAAAGILRGGLAPGDIASAVRRTKARVVHAHNIQPTFGWRALDAAHRAGAGVVLHLHNYRLVCAAGTCFTLGEDCTRCHGRNTLPGVRLNCRSSRVETSLYAAGISLWQPRVAQSVGAFVVPSQFTLRRLEALGAPLGGRASVIPYVQRVVAGKADTLNGTYALYAGRLTPEKGVAEAIAACKIAGVPLVVAGDGPQGAELRSIAGGDVRFTGMVDASELSELRAGAAVALIPSLYEDILPLSALESLAFGLPVVASRAGGLAEIVPEIGLHPAGDVAAMAERIRALWCNEAASEASILVARERTSPEVVAAALRRVYDSVS